MPIVGLNFSDQQIFDGLNLVLPAWALLVIAPRWRVTHWIVNLTVFGICVLYTGLFATLMLQSETTFDFAEFFTYEVTHHLDPQTQWRGRRYLGHAGKCHVLHVLGHFWRVIGVSMELGAAFLNKQS